MRLCQPFASKVELVDFLLLVIDASLYGRVQVVTALQLGHCIPRTRVLLSEKGTYKCLNYPVSDNCSIMDSCIIDCTPLFPFFNVLIDFDYNSNSTTDNT